MDNGRMVRLVHVGRFTTAMGTLALVAGCVGSPPPSSPIASASREQLTPDASATATAASPSADATPGTTDVQAPGGPILMVVADELRLRAEPGTDGALVGSIKRGTVVQATDGPSEADGFRWYEVVDTTGRGGWAADGDRSDPWLSPIESTEDATPLLTFAYGCDVVGPFNAPSTVVFEDGRVVLREPDSGAYIVRRLASAGMAHLEDNVMSSPYLRTSAEYTPVPQPGAEPPGHGLCAYSFTVGADTEPIVVSSVSWFGEQEEAAFYEPAPERKALDAIARNLMVIDSVLDEASWEPAGWLPFIAEDYYLWVGRGVGPAPEGSVPMDASVLPIDVDAFGEPIVGGRCGPISREQAFELARVLNQPSAATDVRLDMPTFYVTGAGADETWWNLTLAPRTPQYALGCDSFGL
jgi:hypothetical protein